MSVDHRFRLHNQQRRSPIGPQTHQPRPEQAVRRRSLGRLLERCNTAKCWQRARFSAADSTRTIITTRRNKIASFEPVEIVACQECECVVKL